MNAAQTTAEPHDAPVFLAHRAYTSPFLVRRRSKESGTKSAQSAAARLARKTQSFSEGLEPDSGERLADIDVFLGGSCNPTTWRRDVAMPLLEASHVKYFNPQVDEWFEELIQIETRAKETAKIVMMVIDNLTRSIVCINEAVEYICRGRRVVLVVQDIEDGTKVEGKELTATEVGDLNGAREFLRNLAIKRQQRGSDVHLFPDVSSATDAVVAWVMNGDLPKHVPEVPRLRKRSSIVLSAWSGHFRFGRRASRSSSSNSLGSVVSNGRKHVEEHGRKHGGSHSIVRHGLGKTNGSVYLGGNLAGTSWREQIAIPLLHEAGIPFYIPYMDYLSFGLAQKAERKTRFPADRWNEIETEKELAEVRVFCHGVILCLRYRSSNVYIARQLILFVIPCHARSIAAMTEAVELILSHGAILLVIEPVEEGTMVEDGLAIVGREYKDLTRARAYLQETAERNDVQVFASVADAVENIVEHLEDGKWPELKESSDSSAAAEGHVAVDD